MSSSFKPFPTNLAETNSHSSAGHLNNKVWDKTKKVWHGPATDVVKKVTGTSRINIFVWTGVHSFFDAITDAKAHIR